VRYLASAHALGHALLIGLNSDAGTRTLNTLCLCYDLSGTIPTVRVPRRKNPMHNRNQAQMVNGENAAGFAVLDDKGRVSLPKPVRTSLGLSAGSSLAYVVVNGTIMLIPQDAHLAELFDKAAQSLAAAGITVEDLLQDLERSREEVMLESYGAEFMADLERQEVALRREAATEASALDAQK
jgi:AbrB family looped-hinge helix DNA binding protein